ncbi:hypothetical protein ACHAXT_004055 [Thalassiosira profunda]
MSEMMDHSRGGNGELVGCSATQAGTAADLTVDASAGTSRSDTFMSPRTAILEAKSSAEELNVSRSRVTKSRQLFETLLKEQKLPSENSPRQSQSKSRQSLPASASASAAGFPRTVAKPRSSLGSGNDIVLARARAAIDGRTKSREVVKERLRADMTSMGVGSGEDSSVSLATSSLKENERDARSPKRKSNEGEPRDMPLKSIAAPTKQSDNADDRTIAKKGKAVQESKDIRAKARERLNATMALLNASDTLESDVPAVASSSNEETSMTGQRTAEAALEERKPSVLSVQQSEMIALARLRQKGDSRTVAKAEQTQTEQEPPELSTEAANALSKIRQKVEVMRRLAEDGAPAESPVQEERVKEEGCAVEETKEETHEEEADVFAALEEHLEQENALAVQRPSLEEADAHRRKKVEHIASAALEMLDLEQTSEDLMDVVGMMDMAQSPTVDAAEPELNFEAIQSCGTGSPALADRPSGASEATSFGDLDNVLFQGATVMQQKQAKERLWPDTKDTCDAVSTSFDNDASVETAVSEESGGGRLWQAAKEEAELTTALAADFLPRCSSRGGGDERQPLSPSTDERRLTSASNQSLHDEPSHSTYNGGYYSQSWIEEPAERKEDEVEAVGVGSEWRGFKRNRMTAMVILGILGGLLPSLYVITTCHFITGDVEVGEDGVEFALHYGLQRFTPIDQAFQYYYGECQAYDSAYSNSPPTLAFALSVAAIIFSGNSLDRSSGVPPFLDDAQDSLERINISTLSIFLTDLCGNGVQCSMGPGSRAAVLSSVVWFILSLEMKLNTPFVPAADSDGVVVIEKDDRIVSSAKRMWRRAKGEDIAPSLARTALQKQRGRIGETEIASYRPPDIV